ncbi:DUF72 domain-containing protein [Bryobacter aggregatus]|uniref:DUF72 domain-containing protein n=1 Tax=Bryobacter aggregatus TaxID=360054 RepID=UPI00068B0D94|nr:DUF72 domain-containing protein [Bryobacter aggregatus]
MFSPNLFEIPEPQIRTRLRNKLRRLAEQEIFVGTSSWKYEGWMGSVYSEERYKTRGKLSRKKFEEQCIAEFAEVFPIVCGDFAFYQFPSQAFWQKLFQTAQPRLRWAFKVPEEVTCRQWPAHARYGARAGYENENFLNADLLQKAFLDSLEPYKDRVSVLIFEFGTMSKAVMPGVDAFIRQINRFLSELPEGWRYAIEIRNPEFLAPDYLACLSSYNVAHVLNAWTRMPEIQQQLKVEDVFTADFSVVRALLRPGRTFEQAVKKFEPYREVQEEFPSVRNSLQEIIARAQRLKQPAYVFVNNRLEGNAPQTIDAVTEAFSVADGSEDRDRGDEFP